MSRALRVQVEWWPAASLLLIFFLVLVCVEASCHGVCACERIWRCLSSAGFGSGRVVVCVSRFQQRCLKVWLEQQLMCASLRIPLPFRTLEEVVVLFHLRLIPLVIIVSDSRIFSSVSDPTFYKHILISEPLVVERKGLQLRFYRFFMSRLLCRSSWMNWTQ